jgi:hypothetical protein
MANHNLIYIFSFIMTNKFFPQFNGNLRFKKSFQKFLQGNRECWHCVSRENSRNKSNLRFKTSKMVLADLGRKITTALHSLSKATIINEEVTRQLFHCFDSMKTSPLSL